MMRKKTDRRFGALLVLEDFLNGRIHRFLKTGTASPEEIEALRAELISDLLPIITLAVGGYRRFKRSKKTAAAEQMEITLALLCKKINDMKAAQGMIAIRELKITPNRRLQSRAQGIFSWGAGDWIIELIFARPGSLRENLYAHVAAGLVSGELARLRRCPYCQTFFIAPQPRMTFCPGHARLYYDRPKKRKELIHGHQ
jgi:hypothetical protein